MEMSVNNSNYRGCRTSAIEAVKRCPFSVQKVYRDKIVGYIDKTALRGSAVHDALEDYGTHCLKNKVATDFDYLNSITMKYASTVPIEVFQETYDILKDCNEFVNFSLFLNDVDAHIEERFYLDRDLNVIDPCEDAWFSSAVDSYYIEHDGLSANIFDYKTSRKIYSKTVLNTKLQKDYYSLLIFLKYPNVEDVNFYFDFIRYGQLVGPICYNRTEHFEYLKDKLIKDVERYNEVVNTKHDLDARPSSFCNLCEIRGICPRFSNGVPEEAIITDEESAVEAARLYKSLQLRSNQVKTALELFLSRNKNIEISEIEGYGIQANKRESVTDLYHLYNELIKNNVPPGKIFDAFKLNKTSFNKLVKGTNINKEDYLTSTITTKTGFYDLENDEDESDDSE